MRKILFKTKFNFKLFFVFLILFFSYGCIYMRLLETQKQLKNFHQNFSVNGNRGLTLIFKKPIFLMKDITKITGVQPSQTEKITNEPFIETYKYYLIRENKNISDIYDIPMFFEFTDGKLSKFILEKNFKHIFSKKFL